MENASNALVMAGGILIAVMIISLAVFTFRGSAQFAENFERTSEDTNLEIFNRKFEIYEARDDLTIQDIVTVTNLAKDINMKNGESKNSIYYIQVILEGGGYNNKKNFEELSQSELYDEMKNLSFKNNTNTEVQKFSCSLQYNDKTNRVNVVKFKKI